MMSTTTRKQTPAQARKSAVESDFATLYALAGLTDAFAAQVKARLVETRQRAAKRVADLQHKPTELEAQAKLSADELSKFWKSLPKQLKVLPVATKARLAEGQKQAQTILAEAGGTYADLAGRGKRVVDDAIGTGRKLAETVEDKAGDVAADVAEMVDPAFEKAQESVTVARQKVTGHSATETVIPRSVAKATATRAASEAVSDEAAARRSATRKAAAKKAAATRAAAKDAGLS
jgi:hypothetical protein